MVQQLILSYLLNITYLSSFPLVFRRGKYGALFFHPSMKFFSKREKTLDGSFFQQCTSYFSSYNTYYSHKEHRTSRSLSVACFRPFPTWLLQSFSGSPVLLNSSDLVTDSLKKTGTTVGIGLFPHLYLPVPTHSDAYPQPLLSILASHKPFRSASFSNSSHRCTYFLKT